MPILAAANWPAQLTKLRSALSCLRCWVDSRFLSIQLRYWLRCSALSYCERLLEVLGLTGSCRSHLWACSAPQQDTLPPAAGPVMNLEFLLDFVLEFVKPLDWQAVLDSPIPLKVSPFAPTVLKPNPFWGLVKPLDWQAVLNSPTLLQAGFPIPAAPMHPSAARNVQHSDPAALPQVVASSLDRLQSVLLTDFADREDLVTCLKASANVPKIAGDPVVHRGERLVDAAVFEAVPWRAAIADGCTHVVVLCTRPASRWDSRGQLMGTAVSVVHCKLPCTV